MDPDEVRTFWAAKAEEYRNGNQQAVHDALADIAAATPGLFRDALVAASREVGRYFCGHGDTPPQPLPDIKKLSDRRTAAAQHAGLCGFHHAEYIGSVDLAAAAERAGGDPAAVTTKNMRNQACYEAGTALNARGRSVQLARKECFTEACRAVWPGDEPLLQALVQALLM